MADDAFTSVCDNLTKSVQALSALGAFARARSENIVLDPKLEALLIALVESTVPGGVKNIPMHELSENSSSIVSQLTQALDFIAHVDQSQGWRHSEPSIINQQGLASKIVIREIEALATQRAKLAAAISSRGELLDVGTGAGWIAIEAAERWTGYKVTGIDVWGPSIALARLNAAQSKVGGQIELRHDSVANLNDENRFSIVWVPVPFLPKQILEQALPRLVKSLMPGGTLILGTEDPPNNRQSMLLLQIETYRVGGHVWHIQDLIQLLASSGLVDIQEFSLVEPFFLIAGEKPAIL